MVMLSLANDVAVVQSLFCTVEGTVWWWWCSQVVMLSSTLWAASATPVEVVLICREVLIIDLCTWTLGDRRAAAKVAICYLIVFINFVDLPQSTSVKQVTPILNFSFLLIWQLSPSFFFSAINETFCCYFYQSSRPLYYTYFWVHLHLLLMTLFDVW